ncbi:IRK-interacting protein-like [Magnolia sinica]|uniref:IRK-interacting protein-like n=1 Tax=Magnolia sinica TaxID=86752 RepID=UPI0026596F98|nr:IRK-interacting protein-like [Magnolia sinica]
MAAQTFQNNHEIGSQEIQAAIAKAVELRALHAALLQGGSPANLKLPICASPSIPRSSNHFSAQDYPVFTPSYEEEPLSGYYQIRSENRRLPGIWDGIGIERRDENDELDFSDDKKVSMSSRKGFSSGLIGGDHHVCAAAEDQISNAGSCANHINALQTAPGAEIFKSGRTTGSFEFDTVTTCNTCKPAVISRETDADNKNSKNSNTVVPVTDSHLSFQSHPKNKVQILSWLFPKLKKKPKAEMSPSRVESESASQFLKDLGIMSLESLKKELLEANENRDAAIMEVAEMKSSLGELKQKLVHLEMYCDELKNALKQAVQGNETQVVDWPNLTKRGRSIDGGSNHSSLMPVTHEAMVEGFLQIVSEARLSVQQFCTSLIGEIEDTDNHLMEKLNSLLQPHDLTHHSKYSKGVLYHMEALINQSLHQDFENCVFEKNGPPRILDPQQDRRVKFSAFVALRNLSWNQVLRKGTKYYSEEFSRFCDQKMSCIISTLNWSRPWPEQLLQSFFVAAKCVWLVHLLAFSFSPPLVILRVDENRSFDPLYMEDILLEIQRPQTAARVKIMVMPGFYVEDKVLRCKVLCRYKRVA